MEKDLPNNFINISYQFFIEDSIIEEFENTLKEKSIAISVKKIPEPTHFSFDGGDVREIIIFISQHKIDLISNLIFSEGFGLIKIAVEVLIEKIKKKTTRKTTISLQIQTEEFKKVSFNLDTDLEGKQVEALIDKINEVIKTAQQENWYKNDDITNNLKKVSEINCSPNSTGQDWQPFSRKANQKKLDDILRNMDNLDS